MRQVRSPRRLLLALGGGVLLTALAAPGVALAANVQSPTSRQASVPPPQPIASGAYGNVMTIKTVSPYGGTVVGTGPSGTVYTVTVPTGTFRVPEQLVLLSPSLSHQPGNIGAQIRLAVMQNGLPVAVPFLKPLSLEIDGPTILSTAAVHTVTTTGQESPVSNVQFDPYLSNPSNEIVMFSTPVTTGYIHTYVVLIPFPRTAAHHTSFLLWIALVVYVVVLALSIYWAVRDVEEPPARLASQQREAQPVPAPRGVPPHPTPAHQSYNSDQDG